MKRPAYPTDLTDVPWNLLEPLLPRAHWWGRPRTVDLREILNATFSVTRTGIQRRALPHDFPKYRTVSYDFQQYTDTRVWEAINDALRTEVRRGARKAEEPTAAIIDSQSVTTTATPSERGDDAGKQVMGHKRSVMVDTLGLVVRAEVQAADISDRRGGKLVAAHVGAMKHRSVQVLGDRHAGATFAEWAQPTFGWTVEVTSRPADAVGFVVIPKRWLVERTFGWLTWCRRLSKDYEQWVESSESFMYIAMINLMLRRLKPA